MRYVEISARAVVDLERSELEYSDVFVPRRLRFKRVNKFRDVRRYWKRLKQIVANESELASNNTQPKYATVEAGPSLYPFKKYCDLTGLLAKYTDPKTKLRYANKELFPVLRTLPHNIVQACLEIRNAQTILK